MKYLIPFCLLALVSCAPAQPTMVCLNPFNSFYGIVVGPQGDPNITVKDKKETLELTNASGDTLVMPKGLCAEIRKAGM